VVPAATKERRAAETSKLALQAIDGLDHQEEFFLWVHYTIRTPLRPGGGAPARLGPRGGAHR